MENKAIKTCVIAATMTRLVPNEKFITAELDESILIEKPGTKFSNNGEIYGKRSKGDRKRNPRWTRK